MVIAVHVHLPNEAVEVYAPVDAEHVRDDLYRIVDRRGEDAEVQFGRGMLFRCRTSRLGGDGGKVEDCLVALAAADSN